MILGDSLLVMTSLAEKEGLKGKVQTIYFDPPYGIKFGSNWQVSTRKREVKDGKGEDATRQPEQIKAFRDTWKLGIHSYLSYLRDRFNVCRDLLTESGSIFVQIGDENVHLVRAILDEVFGSENFVAEIPFQTATNQNADRIQRLYDFILWYGKGQQLKFRRLYRGRTLEEIENIFSDTDEVTGKRVKIAQLRESLPSETLSSLEHAGRLTADQKYWKRSEDDFVVTEYDNVWYGTVISTFSKEKKYAVQTSTIPIQRCLLMTTDPGDLVLDPTCGSGTTAYVAEQWGRRWITIDTSRVALALARTRLMSARYPYYILSDSLEGVKKEAEMTGKIPPSSAPATENDVKKGFVYERVAHITLKSIANNEEIDAIYARWQEKLEPIRKDLNKKLKESWEEWQIPREAGEKWSDEAKQLHAEWWKLRRERQKEIDESVSRHADTELLYDKPYEDNKRIRVTGPFTVESLSPHRVLSTADDNLDGTVSEKEAKQQQDFVSMILENLRKAGVQNTIKNERLKFDRLEPFAGVWLHAQGEYTESGKSKRVAVSIGPEHGTVGPELVKEAAKEAVKGVGFDLLIVCGFAFDPHVSEETKRYGKLTVLTARMNPDLAMGDELLKKTGAGNLFMVFGEPDMDVKQKDGKLVVTIKGLDVYDPTTGQIRSSSTEDIACWFIDTNYNGESFFVRHAYFLGEDEPYEKLKRALRAEIDEAAWSTLYSNKSRPFDVPETGKIAVKVINHYGDEVLKVFEVK